MQGVTDGSSPDPWRCAVLLSCSASKRSVHSPLPCRQALFVACLCLLVNACIFLYVVVLVRLLLRLTAHFDLVAPGATATSMLLGAAAFAR